MAQDTQKSGKYAVVEVLGKQYKVQEGRFLDVDLFSDLKDGEKLKLDQVLLISNGKDVKIGQPVVEGAVVEATLMKNIKEKKIIVYKMKPKKGTRKKQGHRQDKSRIMIDKIAEGAKASAA